MPLTSKFIPQGVHNISNKELLEFTHKSEDKKTRVDSILDLQFILC